MTKKKVYLGKIVSTHGVKGLIKIEFYNTDSENLKNYSNKTLHRKSQDKSRKKVYKGGNCQSVKLLVMKARKKL